MVTGELVYTDENGDLRASDGVTFLGARIGVLAGVIASASIPVLFPPVRSMPGASSLMAAQGRMCRCASRPHLGRRTST